MTPEQQKAVEEFTEMNLTKKGLYHYNDMQDAFLIGLFKGEKMQPSLHSNLDEAAEEYGRNTFINECMENGVCDDHDLSDAFKAGAEWMAKQGVSMEVVTGVPWRAVDAFIHDHDYAEDSIIQIRRKEGQR